MNIEDVRSVFGAVAPAPAIAEQKSSVLPVILLIAVVGITIYAVSRETEPTYIEVSKNNNKY